MTHIFKGFRVVNGTEVDIFLEFPCFMIQRSWPVVLWTIFFFLIFCQLSEKCLLLNNNIDKWFFHRGHQLLSLGHSYFVQWHFTKGSHCGRDGECMWAHLWAIPYSASVFITAHWWWPNQWAARANATSSLHFIKNYNIDNSVTWGQVNYLTPYSLEGTLSIFTPYVAGFLEHQVQRQEQLGCQLMSDTL